MAEKLIPPDRICTSGEAGQLFEPPLTSDRIRQMMDCGQLRGFLTRGGRRFFFESDVLALIERRRLAEPPRRGAAVRAWREAQSP
jgi:hypothetical protein